MSPTRHAALRTCAPSRMVGGAFCRHPNWLATHAPREGMNPLQVVYRCDRCCVEVRAYPER